MRYIIEGENGKVRVVTDLTDVNFHFSNRDLVYVKNESGEVLYYGRADKASKHLGDGRKTTAKF